MLFASTCSNIYTICSSEQSDSWTFQCPSTATDACLPLRNERSGSPGTADPAPPGKYGKWSAWHSVISLRANAMPKLYVRTSKLANMEIQSCVPVNLHGGLPSHFVCADSATKRVWKSHYPEGKALGRFSPT